ncbi:MAG TPA: 2-isopropylmalate synthase, partial [Longimicrobiales bacterium]|nr:2-isopropylmalate synthase [Longimicrobiales bacterium]
MARITIFDTTLRDGEQSPGASMTTPEKLRLAHQLDALGVDVIEAGFPITSPDDFAAVRQIASEVRRPVIAALARATAQDIDRAAEAVEVAERARIHTFIATSDVHLARKLRISREECLERTAEAVRRARSHADDVEFSAEDATRTDPAFLAEVVRVAVGAGATTINIPDTVGYTYPTEYRALIEMLFREVPGLDDVVVSVHCHDDLGLAVANSLAAIEAGARQVECTINGIGERAGNAALEEIAMALHVRNDVLPHETGIRTREIYRTSQLLSRITGIHPQPNKAIVGKNAFAHESGIHQDGMIKDRSTYEIMTPDLVGVPESKLVLGKHSGRHALAKRCRELGYELDGPALDRAYKLFKLLADQKKTILDEDLLAIVDQGTIGEIPQAYRLRALDVLCGARQAEAKVRLADGSGIEQEATATGDGPLAAAFSAVDLITGLICELEDLAIRAATPGRDAVGEVN